MKTKLESYPPLTQDDIFLLKGDPMGKRLEDNLEEWTYYICSTNTKEYYIFKDGTLIGYNKVKEN